MKRSLQFIIVAVLAAAAFGGVVFLQTARPYETTSVEAVHALLPMDSAHILLDVRTPEEHAAERIAGTPLMPLSELESRIHELDTLKSRTIIVYCRSGNRSGMAAEILHQYGFKALNMEGGVLRWKDAGYSTITGNDQ